MESGNPTVRPQAPVIGFQRWDKLLFLHWSIPTELLRPLIPARLELDTHEGRAYVTVTPFTVRRAHLRGVPPLPGIAEFHEINVRTYVRLGGVDPAVWFFSLDAASALAVAAARVSLRLPYCYARIARSIDGSRQTYDAARLLPDARAAFSGSWTTGGTAAPAQPGTLEHFLVERYVLFSRAFGDKLFRLQVHHEPWPLQAAHGVAVRQTLASADGLPQLEGEPLAQYSEGVDVDFFAPAIV
ncbi:MAG TPA: DUF2071 domain-containing protein [Gemmatimonadales bacterium]|nr:DUF2071 domain-containing protein [Gemmatimonadales bacterium]